MIESYGLHWLKNQVFWGRPNNPGTLLGAASRSSRARQIDFREQRGIYALYSDYELVYVGQTGGGDDRLFNRLRAHKRDHLSERWNRFSWFGTQWVTQQGRLSVDNVDIHGTVIAMLNIMEAVATAIAEPRLNLQRGRWGEAKQYYQVVPDDDVDDSEDEQE
jgi:hypothetical protein